MIREIFEPLIIGLKMLRKKPITYNFPPDMPLSEGFRGRHLLNIEKCVGCGTCARACPNNAITMVTGKVGEKEKKLPSIDYAKCAFCGLCVDVCPTKALTETHFPIILAMDKKKLKMSPIELSKKPELPPHAEVKPKSTLNWARAKSLWVLNYFTGCCFIEAIPWASSGFDMERFGMLVTSSPRHSDVLIIGGYVTRKTMKRIIRIYSQMPRPKFVIALGNCPMTGGTYWDSYNTVKNVAKYIPVDIWIGGCPPRPESIGVAVVHAMHAIFQGYTGKEEKVGEMEEKRETPGIIEKEFVLPFGPQHPSSGNFHVSLKVDGETVVEAIPSPGYLHRGFEKLMEYRYWFQNIMITPRVCVLDGGNYEMPYVEAVEKIAGIEVPERAKYIRVIQMELSRIQSHLINIGIVGLASGFDTIKNIAWGDRERVMYLKELLSGGRVYDILVTPGGVRRDMPPNFPEVMRKTIRYFRERLKDYERLMFDNDIFIERTVGVGVVTKEMAEECGVTGPILRAAGVKFDVRKAKPYEKYDELEFEIPTYKEGDVYHRMLVRKREIEESLRIIEQALEKMPEGPIRNTKMKNGKEFRPFAPIPPGEAAAIIECARGEFGYHVISTGDKMPYRVKIKGPTLENIIFLLPKVLKGVNIADVPVIYWSLDNCPADHDR